MRLFFASSTTAAATAATATLAAFSRTSLSLLNHAATATTNTHTPTRRGLATMQSHKVSRNDNYGGAGVTFNTVAGPPQSSIIWLHGLGDSGEGWAGVYVCVCVYVSHMCVYISPGGDRYSPPPFRFLDRIDPGEDWKNDCTCVCLSKINK